MAYTVYFSIRFTDTIEDKETADAIHIIQEVNYKAAARKSILKLYSCSSFAYHYYKYYNTVVKLCFTYLWVIMIEAPLLI